MNSVVSALGTISSLHVSETIVGWEEAQPKGAQAIFAYPIDHDEARKPFAIFGGAGDEDAQATLNLTVTCYCYRGDNDGAKLRKLRTDLIMGIEAALEGCSTLMALLLDLRPVRVVTDRGVLQGYSVFDYDFEADYIYGHETGG
jgi:hypothetical protein